MTLTKSVDQVTILKGDRSKLKDLLRSRLIECGWRDEVRLLCHNTIKEKGFNLTVEQIVQDVTPKARARVPDSLKKELLMKIKSSLAAQEGIEL
ncbi:unnamed protein product [Hermetia illucens]|uniref:Enhancer of yellow 2 transcription factor n=1 Tax=Hermetia illucens TaxID=343691 RepID=A0A7R8UY46_HERIL|nr:enhancer of yellow 2 transcription factor [Hermetia illucens]CAD7089203.1 unnamed protein product [Hermetia illucens]